MLGARHRVCRVCTKQESKYTCPRCDISYCSIPCYQKHGADCTEQFYRQHVLDETSLRNSEDTAVVDKQRQALVEILKRDRLQREPDLFLTEQEEDEDLDLAERLRHALNISEEEESEKRLAVKLEAISVEKLESVLTGAELKEFYRAAGSNAVLKIQSWKPWWEPSLRGTKGISSLNRVGQYVPRRLKKPLPPLETLTKKTPDTAIVYHVVNVVAAYVGVMRRFNGDVLCDSDTLVDAAKHLYEGARVLREKDFQPCSVREALTYKDSSRLAKGQQSWRTEMGMGKNTREKNSVLEEDVKLVLSLPEYVLEALKDTWLMFHSVLGLDDKSLTLPALRRAEKKLWFLLVWANEVYSPTRVEALNLKDIVSYTQEMTS